MPVSGGCGGRNDRFRALNRELMETDMSTNTPVLPIAGGALIRAFASLVALVTYWLKIVARAQRHRREARQLAKLDQIGRASCRERVFVGV